MSRSAVDDGLEPHTEEQEEETSLALSQIQDTQTLTVVVEAGRSTAVRSNKVLACKVVL